VPMLTYNDFCPWLVRDGARERFKEILAGKECTVRIRASQIEGGIHENGNGGLRRGAAVYGSAGPGVQILCVRFRAETLFVA
jgi:hypothetical protein